MDYDNEWDGRRIQSMRDTLGAIDDFLICNWCIAPHDWEPDAYRKALHELCMNEQKLAIYFEHQRLIKLNEDFYGPTHKEEPPPFN